MARPQKFRHSREALADPHIAAKLGAFVLDIEGLRAKRKQIDLQIAAGYDAVDDAGFEKKFVRKVIALRAKEESVRLDEEEGIEAYEFAVEKGVPLACARRKGDLPSHNPKTGEVIEDQPETATGSGRTAQVCGEGMAPPLPAGTADAVRNTPAASVSDAIARKDHQSTGVLPAGGSSPSASEIDEIADPAQPSPPKQAEPIKAGEGAPPSSPAILSDEEVVPAFLRKEYVRKTARDYRPHCLNPDNCGSSDLDHCYQCRKALAAAEMETA